MVFHAAEVVQERNEHDLMRDFADELTGYQRNRELAALLEGLSLESGTETAVTNLSTCYEALVAAGFFPPEELELLDAWSNDVAKVKRASQVESETSAMAIETR